MTKKKQKLLFLSLIGSTVGYGDYIPTGGQHSKKPLTRAQIKKLQQAYATAGAISESVKNLEEQEQESTQKEVEEGLKMVF